MKVQVSAGDILSNAFTAGLQGVLPAKTTVATVLFDELFCDVELIEIQHAAAIDKK
jgi:hypothetical protein